MRNIIIHNITNESGLIVEKTCGQLWSDPDESCNGTISFVNDNLYDYEISMCDVSLVPFLMRFFHKIPSNDYERIEII